MGNFTGKVNTYERPKEDSDSDEDNMKTSSMVKKSSYTYEKDKVDKKQQQ